MAETIYVPVPVTQGFTQAYQLPGLVKIESAFIINNSHFYIYLVRGWGGATKQNFTIQARPFTAPVILVGSESVFILVDSGADGTTPAPASNEFITLGLYTSVVAAGVTSLGG